MPILWAFFNLAPAELLILAAMGLAPLLLAGTVVLIVLRATRKERAPEDDEEE